MTTTETATTGLRGSGICETTGLRGSGLCEHRYSKRLALTAVTAVAALQCSQERKPFEGPVRPTGEMRCRGEYLLRVQLKDASTWRCPKSLYQKYDLTSTVIVL
jgi:hypothetical protein